MTFIAHPFLCSVCKKPRENDANHWFCIYLNVFKHGDGTVREAIVVEKWCEEIAALPEIEHACGQEHMQALVERWAVKGVLT